MNKERFVNIKRLEKLHRLRELIRDEINSYEINHCRECGDTEPTHGFYPLWGMASGVGIYQTSGLLCNKCARTPEEYNEMFMKKELKK